MAWWQQRVVSLLALVTLIGSPVAGTACALLCATDRVDQVDQNVVQAAAGSEHHHASMPGHHHGTMSQEPVDRSLAALPAPDCDTHGTADSKSAATLTTSRSDIQKAGATPVPTLNPASLPVTTSLRAHAGYGPPPGASIQNLSRVLRI